MKRLVWPLAFTVTMASAMGQGNITSSNIRDLTIVDADINASAAITGTKISPSFGAAISGTTISLTALTNQIILDSDGTNTGTITITTLTADRTYTLPDASGTLATSGTAAPVAAQYVTLATNGDLTQERVLTGTTNQIVVTDGGAGSTVTLSAPQNIHTGASPTFAGVTLSGLTATRLMATSGSSAAASVGNLASWVAGTTNRVTVTNDSDGTITLSGPQDINAGASPTFVALGLTALTNQIVLDSDGTNTGTITITSLTADRTYTFPDATATVITTGNLSQITATGTIASGTWEGTTVAVNQGGSGATSLTDGGVLLGSGTGAITATAVLGDGEILIGDNSGDPVALDVGSSTAITILGTVATGTWQATDVGVGYGGTGLSTMTDGGVLLGSAGAAITPMAVLADSEFIVGDGSGDPVAESGGTLRTSIGVGTGDSPQFTAVTLTAATVATLEGATANEFETFIVVTDPTADRTVTIPDSSGTLFFSGGTDLSVGDGGTGASTFTDGGVLLGSGTSAITATAVLADGEILIGDGSTDPSILDIGSSSSITILGAIATGTWQATDVGVAYGGTGVSTFTDGGVLLGSGASAITATAVLADGEILIGDASGDPSILDVGSASSITILGTIATGTWQATDVGVAYGGTGVSTFTDGGVLLGSGASAVTATAVLTNGQLLIGDGTGDPTLATITAVADETTVTNGAGTITIGIVDPLGAAKGGSGAASFTDGGILLGSGTGAFTALAVATNGQIPIGDGTGDPTLAVITGTTNEVDITNGAGTIQVGLPSNVQVGGTLGVTGVWTMTDATASIGGIAYEFPADDGDSGEQLQTDGSGTLTWSAAGGVGGGDVSATGSPANNQMAIWTDSTTIEGDADLTWDDTNLYIKAAVPLLFEGATANNFETSIAVTDPTADRTITIPDDSGTLFFSGGTDLSVADGGTGASSLTDGGVLLGSGTGAITPLAVLGDGEIVIGDNSGDPVVLDIGSSTSVTIVGTIATGTWQATDVGVAYGGTGVSTFTDGGVLLGSGASAITATAVLADGEILIGDASGDPAILDVGSSGSITILGTVATGTWQATDVGVAYGGTGLSTMTDGGILLGSGASAITPMAVLADSAMIVGDGSGDPVAESGATLRTSIGVGTGDSPQLTALTLTSGTPMVLEGATANDFETSIAVTDPTADRTITFKDGTGTVAFTSDITGGAIDVSGTPANNQLAVWIDADTLEGDSDLTFDGTDLTIGGDLIVSGYGPHIFGGPLVDYYRLALAGPYTSGGGSNHASFLDVGDVLTGASGDTAFLSEISVQGVIVTQTATETIAAISSVRINEPGITDNLTGDITVASTLHVVNAPTEGEDNYALLVGSGATKLGGTLVVPAGGATATDADLPSSVNTVLINNVATQGPNLVLAGIGNNAVGGSIQSYATRAASAADANTIVQDGDTLLRLRGFGADGADYQIGAEIKFNIDGTPGSGDMPGEIIFSTTADGASGVTERMSINAAGYVTATVIRFVIPDQDLGNDVAGPRLQLGHNNNGTERNAGTIRLSSISGAEYVWNDTNGDLRIHGSAPAGGTTDTAGTVVGTQTSWWKLKENITEFVDYQSALDAVIETPLYSFNQNGRHYDAGYVIYDYNKGDWFSHNDGYQQTPALNERQIPAYLAASIKVHDAEIKTLEQRVATLEAIIAAM